jgi:hypothetical protein
MGFSFTGIARCDYCGEFLSSSESSCDHDGELDWFEFRPIGTEDRLKIEATPSWKWHRLKSIVGESWIRYQCLGASSVVEELLSSGDWDSAKELPTTTMSIDAPNDVREYLED